MKKIFLAALCLAAFHSTALAAEKMTMVVVTHEMGFARDVADRAMLIDAGSSWRRATPGSSSTPGRS